MIFRVYYREAGGHTHMRFFSGPAEGQLGKCGDLCMRNEEFEVFRERFGKAAGASIGLSESFIQFRRDVP